jgi:hypothetical protein
MANVPISAFTVPANTVGIGATGYSLTGSSSASFMDLAGTWNTTGTPTLIKANVTDTASNAASLLMDLQVGGNSLLKMSKSGILTLGYSTPGIIVSGTGSLYSRFTTFYVVGTSSLDYYAFNTSQLRMASNLGLSWVAGNDPTAAADLTIGRRGAANLRFGAADAAAPVAQTLSVQSVVAGTTNTAGAALTITGSQGTGTGAGGSIIFQVAPAGSSGTAQNALATALQVNGNGGITGQDGATANTVALRNGTAAQAFNLYGTYTDASNYERLTVNFSGGQYNISSNALGTGSARAVGLSLGASLGISPSGTTPFTWTVTSSGHFLANADNSYDIGASGASRPRSVYAGTSITPGRGVTVATLPTPSTGMIARVTDATAPVIGATVAGGGAAYALVNYNGANWTVIGV